MRTRSAKLFSKKFLSIMTAIVMMAVILVPSIQANALSTKTKECIELYYGGTISRSVNTSQLQYNMITKTLTLKGGNYHCFESCFLSSNVKGLRIYLEKDVTIYDGYISLSGDTTITGPGKLTIVPTSKYTVLPMAIGVDAGCNLTIEYANVDVSASSYLSEIFGSRAILGGLDSRLIVRDSNLHAKGEKGAISNFNRGILLSFCNVTYPSVVKKINGSYYESNGKNLAKEITIKSINRINEVRKR